MLSPHRFVGLRLTLVYNLAGLPTPNGGLSPCMKCVLEYDMLIAIAVFIGHDVAVMYYYVI